MLAIHAEGSHVGAFHFHSTHRMKFVLLNVRLGGLGLQSAVKLAPSAFLASSHATADLVRDILPGVSFPLSSALLEDALAIWSSGHDCQPPEGAGAAWQKSWDEAGAQALAYQLLEGASDDWFSCQGVWVLAACPAYFLPWAQDG